MSLVKIALLQMVACGNDQQANRTKGEAFCRRVSEMGADVALFPELWNVGYTFYDPAQPGARESWQAQAVGRDDDFVIHFKALAKELKMAIALTYLERWNGAPRNSVSLIDRHGEIALTYAKVHTCDFDVEAALTPGDDFYVCTLDTDAGELKIGAMICFDREFPESARLLMLKGAELILTPNACELEANRLGQFRARACENMVGVAMTNYAAPQENGHSVAFDAVAFDDNGAVDPLIVEAGESEGVYLAEFDMDKIRAYREREVWGNAFRKPRCYDLLTSPEVEGHSSARAPEGRKRTMEKHIKEIYNDHILAQALARYGIAKDNVRLLDGFESFIYEYEKGGRGYVLRVSHSSRRTSGMIGGEVEWLNYLADNGVPAARAVLSNDGRLVEVVDAGDTYFSAVSFEKALGTHPSKEEWRAGLPGKLGQIMGRMHALTKRYRPSEVRFKRPEWDEELEGFAEKHLPPSETKVIEKINALMAYLHTLPQDDESYGLLHTDMHGGNFFVDDGKITLFDFDDCQYAWFVYDIALALFYVLSHNCVSEEDIAWAKDFLGQFMEGYNRENSIAPEWLKQIPYFLKLREMDLYVVIHRSFDLDDLDPWCASFMDNRKYKIENDVPYVDMSFG